jgi:hypothetical protein
MKKSQVEKRLGRVMKDKKRVAQEQLRILTHLRSMEKRQAENVWEGVVQEQLRILPHLRSIEKR